MGINFNDYIVKIRLCSLKRDRLYRLSCETCNSDRGYGPKINAHQDCRSCRTKKVFQERSLSEEYSQDINDGGRRKYRAFCQRCKKDRGLKRKRDFSRLCAECNSPRFKDNICRKIAKNLRSRVSEFIRGKNKSGSAVRDLGCSIEQFKTYIESKFEVGMTWENYGEWHIDHIRPLSSFNLADKRQFLQACHYTNLQPLWAKDNLVKSSKYEEIKCQSG